MNPEPLIEPSQQETAASIYMAEDLKQEADGIVRTHVLWAMGAGAVPIPIMDVVAVSGVQIDMLRQLFRLYGQDFNEALFKSWIGTLSGATLARIAAGAIKAIPGIGTIIGGASQLVLSGATTYAIGQVVIRHLEAGGSSTNFDPARFKDYFDEKMNEGRQYVSGLGNTLKPAAAPAAYEVPAEPVDPADDVIARLHKLAELKAAGVITEEEFQQMKTRLMQSW
jgi:uncharacterized protein (DUF697 family)